MKRLFQRLRDRYDYVIVDLSPLVPVVDVRAATHLVDSYLFVVEGERRRLPSLSVLFKHLTGFTVTCRESY